MKTKFIFIFLFPLSILFNQDYDENIIEIPKEDFIEIATFDNKHNMKRRKGSFRNRMKQNLLFDDDGNEIKI